MIRAELASFTVSNEDESEEFTIRRLTEKQLINIIDTYKKQMAIFIDEERYLKAKNTTIMEQGVDKFGLGTAETDSTAPNWRIVVSYGRKIIKTTTGYMYKPGLINYIYENKKDKEMIEDIFKDNNEPVLNQTLGTYQGTNGKVYELHYIEPDGIDTTKYKMTHIKAADGIAIYNHDIIPKMVTFIRMYTMGEHEFYEVYYDDVTITYKRRMSTAKKGTDLTDNKGLELVEEQSNLFKEIPAIEIDNNINYISDISIIKEMIDAYDNIISGSMIEFSRFAFAYLLLVGMKLDKKDKEKLKELRIFEALENKDAVTFLTKDIPTEFLTWMSDKLKHEIHTQSFIPDVDDIKFSGSASGVAIDKFIYIMEYIAADKEAYFRLGIDKRLRLINQIHPINDIKGIEVTFSRNLPADDLSNAQVFAILDGRGISREWLITNYTKVKDAALEIEKARKEAKKRQKNFLDGIDKSENDNQEDEDVEE